MNETLLDTHLRTVRAALSLARRPSRNVMAAPRYRQRPDSNQPEIVAALLKCGFSVVDLTKVGGVITIYPDRDTSGLPDLLVGRAGKCCLLELKTLEGKLSPLQEKFHTNWSGCTFTVHTPEEAVLAATEGCRG